MDQTRPSINFPMKMGVILGLIYCILIFIENRFFALDTILFAAAKTLGFFIILAGLFYTALETRKQAGGYITFQECLRAMLVVIAVSELFYLIFNLIYVTYIDPKFFTNLKTSTLAFLQKANLSKDEINNRMKNFDGAGNITFWSVIQSYGFAIIIDALFAVIFASLLKKNPPATRNQNNI